MSTAKATSDALTLSSGRTRTEDWDTVEVRSASGSASVRVSSSGGVDGRLVRIH